jgi:RNA polymerase sigma factor (sigma-70 family)
MPAASLTHVLRYLRMQPEAQAARDLNDSELLERFRVCGEETAFALLVQRHGPMVLGVCRRLLGDAHAAEDAFQATFLVLVRKAGSIRKQSSVASWLYGVARRVAFKARMRAARSQFLERQSLAMRHSPECDQGTVQELRIAVDEELEHLPEKYRAALVLCGLEGKTHDQAARELGCPRRSLSSRLARARELLRTRLTRRGFTVSTVLLAAVLSDKATAAVPAILTIATVRAAMLKTAAVSANVATLTQEGIKAMSASKVKAGLALIFMAAAMTAFGHQFAAKDEPPPSNDAKPPPPKAVAEERKPKTDLNGDPLPEGALLRFGTVRFRHPGCVNALAISPDGKSLATTGYNGGLVWDASDGKPGLTFRTAHFNYAAAQNMLAFSPDGQKVLHLGERNSLVARDRATGRVDLTLPIKGQVHSFCNSPDGKLLALGTHVGVQVLEAETGRVVWSTKNGPEDLQLAKARRNDRDRMVSSNPYSQGAFSPDGKLLAVHASDATQTIRLLDSTSGEEQRRIELDARLFQFAFSSDSKYIATTERENAVRVYETATGRRVHSWTVKLTNPYENYTFAVAFAPNGKTLAVGATDNLVHLWDLETGRELAPLRGHSWYVVGLAFDPKGRWLYSTGWDGSIRRWDTATWKEKLVPADTATGTMTLSPDGRIIVWEGDGGVFHVSDAVTGKKLRTLPGNPAGVTQLAFSPDGSILAAAGHDMSVQIWDMVAGKVQRQWLWNKGKDPHASPERMAFTPDGKLLATSSFRSGEVILWDVQTGKRHGQVQHMEVYGVAFSSDGSTLVTSGWDRSVRWWHMPDLKLMETVTLPEEVIKGPDGMGDARLHALARSPDGRQLATLDLGGAFSVWDMASRKVLRSFPGLHGQSKIAFSPDGQWLTAGGYSGDVGLWDVRTGQQVLKLTGHPARVFSVAFSPDGRRLFTGSDDRTVLAWDLRPKTEDKTQHSLESLWDALAGADVAGSYRAIWLLADGPERLVPFLKGKLKPPMPADKTQLPKLLDALDSDVFAQRETASKELKAMGETIETELQEELAKENSLEKKRRLLQLVGSLANAASDLEIRQIRAITALAWANTAEAKELLVALAKGDPNARLTREARAALEWIGRQ